MVITIQSTWTNHKSRGRKYVIGMMHIYANTHTKHHRHRKDKQLEQIMQLSTQLVIEKAGSSMWLLLQWNLGKETHLTSPPCNTAIITAIYKDVRPPMSKRQNCKQIQFYTAKTDLLWCCQCTVLKKNQWLNSQYI